jgi:hypothetical protein
MRIRQAVIVAALLSASLYGQAREVWEGSLPDGYVDRFIEFYRKDPSALSRWAGGLASVSSEQLHRVIVSLDTTHFTYMYPVSVRGYNAPQHHGIPLEELSLMAVRAGRMIAIPYQIDEYDKTGLIWIEGHSDAEPEGEIGVFDDFDELVFMFRDGGQVTYDPDRHGNIEGKILGEIRLDSPRNNPRYVYLVRNNPERSDADYVGADLDKGRIRSTVVEMEFDPQNFLDVQHAGARIGPHAGENVFDSSWLHISTGLFNKYLRVGLDTRNNIKVQPIAVKDGPVRVNLRMKARIWYLHLPTFFSREFNVNFYEQAVRIPSRFAIDSVRTLKLFMLFLKEPRIEFALDFHNLDGAEVTFQTVYENGETGYVDGEMSDFEKRMQETRLPGDWVFMDSNEGWQMFFANHLPVVPGGLFDAFLDGMTMRMLYEDDSDSDQPWEKHPGAAPRFGFTSEGLPRTALDLINAVPRLDFRNMDTLGEAIIALEKADRSGALNDYDTIVNKVLARLDKAGKITSVEELADAFMADLNRMNFRGLPRKAFNDLVRDSILAAVDNHTNVSHGAVLRKMIELAKERDLDIRQIRYATMDNTLWFPDWVGPGGPKDFHWQVKNAPSATVRPWVGGTQGAR